MARWKYFLSCEHGGNHIPTAYQPLFKGAEEVLASHRGWDPGALELFHALQQQPLILPFTVRPPGLLVELTVPYKAAVCFRYYQGLPPKEKAGFARPILSSLSRLFFQCRLCRH